MQDHKEWVKNVFDRASVGYGEKGCCFFEYFGKKLVQLANLAEGDKVLDVATGKGAVLFPAAEAVGSQGMAVGIDLSDKMIQEAGKKNRFPWVELRQMDGEQLSLPDHFFDTVFCAFALYFFSNIPQALSEFKRVLKPGGRLAISTFRKRAALDRWVVEKASQFGVTSGLNSISLDSDPALTQLLASAGFTQIETHEEPKLFWHESAEEWWNSLWTHGLRSRLEQLSPEDLESLKKEALIQAGPGRVSEERYSLFCIARS
jgi:ubiquinone/menaquinone biosynthesis C-methylase UbiE